MGLPEVLNRRGKRLVNLGTEGNSLFQGISRPVVARKEYNQKQRLLSFDTWYGGKAYGWAVKDFALMAGNVMLWTFLYQHLHLPVLANGAFFTLTFKKFVDMGYDMQQGILHIRK